MITIQNTLIVKTLFLTWQSNENRNKRYFVGSLTKTEDNNFYFSYSVETNDYKEARKVGFVGYPAFKLGDTIFRNDVMATFMKRLPPRSRRDFVKYLGNHHLPSSLELSDFSLISHTGVQLPSDGFDLIPDLSEADIPFDYLMELAGTRYCINNEEFKNINLDVEVTFKCDDGNSFDSKAVAVYVHNQKLGFINRLMCPSVRSLIKQRALKGYIAKKSGTEERPLINVMISVG